MDVLDHLIEEHRKTEDMLRRLADSDPGAERERVVSELDEALTLHMKVEEMFLYPLIAEAVGDEAREEADVEHALAREGLASLKERSGGAGFGAAVDMLTAGIEHHVEEEESELFPKLRQRAAQEFAGTDPDELEEQAKSALADGGSGGSDGQTRDELYAKAQAADIAGRSQMTKQELAEALEES